jgi:hypothetical protein
MARILSVVCLIWSEGAPARAEKRRRSDQKQPEKDANGKNSA